MGIGSLKRWARHDNLDKFCEVNKKSIFMHIDNATSNKTDTELARAMYACYGDIFVCAD